MPSEEQLNSDHICLVVLLFSKGYEQSGLSSVNIVVFKRNFQNLCQNGLMRSLYPCLHVLTLHGRKSEQQRNKLNVKGITSGIIFKDS